MRLTPEKAGLMICGPIYQTIKLPFAKMRVVHEGDDMGEGSGMTLYGFMHEYQKTILRGTCKKQKALLEEIQEKRAEMPCGETMVFKQLADPVATFDLIKTLKRLKKRRTAAFTTLWALKKSWQTKRAASQ
ncbi:MAG: hypothetical protein H6925_04880 [Holosporaceae bacterium]|nr:MAG: hypothetical protein H6925_04880 [Holosporaceae bacterium]